MVVAKFMLISEGFLSMTYPRTQKDKNVGSTMHFRERKGCVHRIIMYISCTNVLFLHRLINEFVSNGAFPTPVQTLSLPLKYSLPPVVLYMTLLLLTFGTVKGRQFNVGMTVFFTVLGLVLARRM